LPGNVSVKPPTASNTEYGVSMHAAGHSGHLTAAQQQAVAPGGIARQSEADVAGRGAVRVAGVLQGAVLEQQLGADRPDTVAAGVDHLQQPIVGDDLGVVVQQEQMVTDGVRRAEIDHGGEVEGPLDSPTNLTCGPKPRSSSATAAGISRPATTITSTSTCAVARTDRTASTTVHAGLAAHLTGHADAGHYRR
jgi:hypothetical protein